MPSSDLTRLQGPAQHPTRAAHPSVRPSNHRTEDILAPLWLPSPLERASTPLSHGSVCVWGDCRHLRRVSVSCLLECSYAQNSVSQKICTRKGANSETSLSVPVWHLRVCHCEPQIHLRSKEQGPWVGRRGHRLCGQGAYLGSPPLRPTLLLAWHPAPSVGTWNPHVDGHTWQFQLHDKSRGLESFSGCVDGFCVGEEALSGLPPRFCCFCALHSPAFLS